MIRRCCYCQHRLDVPGDDETRTTNVRKVPLCRDGRDLRANAVVACALCAQMKGPLTDAEFRFSMGDPTGRKQLINRVSESLNPARWALVS